MESISGKLLAAREEKGVSLEQAARDTHISKRYIVALESENFDDFPGEAYFLGFLRSYSAYLGLNSDEVVTLYRNIQLQEQPAPINELLDRKPQRKVRLAPILITLLVLILVGGVVTLFVTGVVRVPSFRSSVSSDSRIESVLRLTEQFVERRFEEGNRVTVPFDDGDAVFQFISINERVAIGSEAGIVELSDGDERLLDITGGGSPDVRIAIRRIYPDETPPATVARIDRVLEPSATTFIEETTVSEEDRIGIALGRTTEQSRERSSRIVASLEGSAPFDVEAEIMGLTLLRFEADDAGRDERILNNGESVRFSVRNLVRLWVSNAGNVRMNVAGTALDLGSQGEVVSLVLRRTLADNAPAVELLPLY